MSDPSHLQNVPLNDSDAAKALRPDPQLDAVHQLEADARDLGLSQDEALAKAWAERNGSAEGGAAPAGQADGGDAPGPDGGAGDLSVGG